MEMMMFLKPNENLKLKNETNFQEQKLESFRNENLKLIKIKMEWK